MTDDRQVWFDGCDLISPNLWFHLYLTVLVHLPFDLMIQTSLIPRWWLLPSSKGNGHDSTILYKGSLSAWRSGFCAIVATLSLLSFNISRTYSFLTIIPCPTVPAHTGSVFQPEALIPICNIRNHPQVVLRYSTAMTTYLATHSLGTLSKNSLLNLSRIQINF